MEGFASLAMTGWPNSVDAIISPIRLIAFRWAPDKEVVKWLEITDLTTDAQAIEFIEKADLSEHDLSGFIPSAAFFARVDVGRKMTPVTIGLPVAVVEKFKARAKGTGVPYQRLMRATLETAK